MRILSALLFALSSNTDNFAVGLSYGVKKIRVPFKSNLIIGLITLFGTVLSMSIGKSLLVIIPANIAGMIGGAIITAIGCAYMVKFILSEIKHKKNNSNQRDKQDKDEAYKRYDKDNSGVIDSREALGLGFALSVNNMGLGVSASVTGLNIIAASVCSFVFSMLFIYSGNLFGKSCVSKFIGKYSDPMSSVLIIALGVYEMIA